MKEGCQWGRPAGKLVDELSTVASQAPSLLKSFLILGKGNLPQVLQLFRLGLNLSLAYDVARISHLGSPQMAFFYWQRAHSLAAAAIQLGGDPDAPPKCY